MAKDKKIKKIKVYVPSSGNYYFLSLINAEKFAEKYNGILQDFKK